MQVRKGVNGLVESARESTEDYDIVLCLGIGSRKPLGTRISSTRPVCSGLEVGETRDAFHQVGRVLVLILNDGDALHAHRLLRNALEMIETYF